MKIYKETYFDRNAWLLDNMDKLNVSHLEFLVLLVINFCREHNKEISLDFLCEKLQVSPNDLDKALASLSGKGYLRIDINEKGICYDIDGVFDFDIVKYDEVENNDIYDAVETFLSRPLTPIDKMKTAELLETYSEDAILDAIRMACAYRKYNLAYVETILRNDKG